MRRERMREALGALGRAARQRALHGAGALLRALGEPAARERALRAWAALRRRRDVVLATGVVVGVLVMILHWS